MTELLDELTPAIGYIRVSMMREEAISPELQRKAILEWARLTGHRVVDWVEDLDKTGRNFKRKIMRVIERVEAGEARAIAVWKYSRFGRSREGVAINLARVERAGAQLLSATEGVDTKSATGRLQRGVIMEFNAYESDRAGEQWMETHQWRRDHGLPAMGRPRFGYIWYPRKRYQPDGTITLQEERYEPDPDTGEVVASLYQRYITGESFRALALSLNDEGHRTVRGDLWTGKAVKRYLDSGFPVGYLRLHLKTCPQGSFPHDCDRYELVRHPTHHHPVIINDETWRQYQERRDFTRTAAPRARTAAYPLTGLVRCGHCENAARRTVAKAGKQVRYVCMARAEKGPHACSGTSMAVEAIEEKIQAFLYELVDEADREAKEAEEEGRAALPGQRRHDSTEQRRARLEDSLAKLERSIARHMRVYAMAEDDDPSGELEKEYLATLRELRAEKSSVTSELAALSAHLEAGGDEARRASVVPVARGLLEEWDTISASRANVLLRRAIACVELVGVGQARVVPAWGAGSGS